MTKTHPRQLELPVMVDVNGKVATSSEVLATAIAGSDRGSVMPGFHKAASSGDQSIYKAISDNYFGSAVK